MNGSKWNCLHSAIEPESQISMCVESNTEARDILTDSEGYICQFAPPLNSPGSKTPLISMRIVDTRPLHNVFNYLSVLIILRQLHFKIIFKNIDAFNFIFNDLLQF